MSLLKDNSGKKSNTTTILWISFAAALVFISLSMFENLGGVKIRPVSPEIILFLLGTSSGLYGWKKKCDCKEMQETMDRLEK